MPQAEPTPTTAVVPLFDPWSFESNESAVEAPAPSPSRRGSARRRTCRQFAILTYRNGSYHRYKRPCEQWDCPRCGPTRIRFALEHLAAIAAAHEVLFLTLVSTADARAMHRVDDRLRHRRGQSMRLRRHRGKLWVVSSVPIGGRKEPKVSARVTADRLARIVALVAMLPNVAKITWSDGWRPSRRDERAAPGTKIAGDDAPALAKALRLAQHRLRAAGFEWPEHDDLPSSKSVPPDVLSDAMDDALARVDRSET